ncbi:hypothetical protein EAG_11676 [Camponotus floridanus]|uniref:Uncharacterized protein n=1 Tax=Camponotus floridanus TaxID=104421 RepID=E2AFZ4_CAMFO|nr:hypothetical protein EAG_11676 [Camponotus floridanus]
MRVGELLDAEENTSEEMANRFYKLKDTRCLHTSIIDDHEISISVHGDLYHVTLKPWCPPFAKLMSQLVGQTGNDGIVRAHSLPPKVCGTLGKRLEETKAKRQACGAVEERLWGGWDCRWRGELVLPVKGDYNGKLPETSATAAAKSRRFARGMYTRGK